jgi:GNAT superfamily N-acetyltransferase
VVEFDRHVDGISEGTDGTLWRRGERRAMTIRPATLDDAPSVALLLEVLGYPIGLDLTKLRLSTIVRARRAGNDEVLVAEESGAVFGLIGIHLIPLLHADGILARITALVVLGSAQQTGVGRQLVAAAEAFAARAGCSRMEVTSGGQRHGAHKFYEAVGYTASNGKRFLKNLAAEIDQDDGRDEVHVDAVRDAESVE